MCHPAENSSPPIVSKIISTQEELQGGASNQTSYFFDIDTNLTSAAGSRNLKNRSPLTDVAGPDSINQIINDDDEDEDEDEDEEFYRGNPVSGSDINLDDIEGPDQNEDVFDDFDDFEALELNSFYGKESKPNTKIKNESLKAHSKRRKKPSVQSLAESSIQDNKRKLKFRGKKSKKGSKITRDKVSGSGEHRQGAASDNHLGNDDSMLAKGNECAMPSILSGCLTFNMIEWALRRARRLLAGQLRLGSRGTVTRPPSEATINSLGEYIELSTRLLAFRFQLSRDEVTLGLEQVDMRRTSLWQMCPPFYRAAASSPPMQSGSLCYNSDSYLSHNSALAGRFRTHSGRRNNLLNAQLGASHMPFARMLEPAYADSIGLPRGGSGIGTLPPARLVSLTLHPEIALASSDLSALFANWGQLINHDLAFASGGRDSTGHEGSCCKLRSSGALDMSSFIGLANSNPLSRICMPIELAPNDPIYGPYRMRCHEFKRSIAALRPGCSLGPRSQVNLVTSFLDASFVYGSSSEESRSLRSNADGPGQLAMWHYFGKKLKPLLPPQKDRPDEECIGRPDDLYCFRSGDFRTNQHLPLVMLHTIHARQHNRLAEAIEAINPHWSSDRIYHEARHINAAIIQHIVFKEYLPLLLGEESGLLDKFNLTINDNSIEDLYWDNYDPSMNPSISQEFAAAAFRQGHSSVPSLVFRLPTTGNGRIRFYPLRQLFRQPWPLFEPWAMDEFMAGLLETPAQMVDQFVSGELAGHLLQEPDEAIGLDLVAINIQRGRDQGVADYNSFREWCGLGKFEDFEQMKTVMSNHSSELLRALYNSVDEIDLFSGGLSEYPMQGGSQVGPTFACIIARQFQALRFGDRFWYESSSGQHAFSPRQLHSIKQVTLARIICTNSDLFERVPAGSGTIQAYAMRLPHPILNPRVPCESLLDIDIMAWQETPPQSAGTTATDDAEGYAGSDDNDD